MSEKQWEENKEKLTETVSALKQECADLEEAIKKKKEEKE